MTPRRVLALSTALLFVFAAAARAQGPSAVDADPRIRQIVAAISEARLRELDTKLVSFGTRETMSSASPTRGVAAARQWIFDELKRSSPKLQVSFDTYNLAPQSHAPSPIGAVIS